MSCRFCNRRSFAPCRFGNALFLRLLPCHAGRLRQLCLPRFHEGRELFLRYLDAAVPERQGNMILDSAVEEVEKQ
jgi:hypothetical protein